jgi:putative lipoprotein
MGATAVGATGMKTLGPASQAARPPSTRGQTARARRRRSARLLVAVLLCFATAARAQSADDWFGADKALHFSVSALLAGTGYAAAAPFTERPGVRLGVGAGFALSLGIAKEIADAAGSGDPSWRDLTWDAVGTGVGLVTAWLVDLAIHSATAPHRAR